MSYYVEREEDYASEDEAPEAPAALVNDSNTAGMTWSEPCVEIFAALAAYSGDVESPDKDSLNKYIGNRYASLGNVLACVRKPASKHGLYFLQSCYVDGDDIVIATTIVHKSGQWIRATPLRARPVRAPKGQAPFCLPASEATTQEKAAAWTYLKRYALLGLAELAAEDDDGEPARTDEPRPHQQAQARQEPQRRSPGDEARQIMDEAVRQAEQRKPTHRTGELVDSAVKSLAEATTKDHMAILAETLLREHGPVASTAPWIAFQERANKLNLSPREAVEWAKAAIADDRKAAEIRGEP